MAKAVRMWESKRVRFTEMRSQIAEREDGKFFWRGNEGNSTIRWGKWDGQSAAAPSDTDYRPIPGPYRVRLPEGEE